MSREPVGGLLDNAQGGLIGHLRCRAPGEQTMAAQHHADIFGMLGRHRAELQAKVEARPLPGQEPDRAAEHFSRQFLGVGAGGDGDHRISMEMIDMGVRHEAVQGGVDGGRARVEIEGAVIEQRHHLVFMGDAAIELFQAFQLVEIEGGEAVTLHRAEVAAGAFDPQHGGRFLGQRIGHCEFGRGVAAAEIGDAKIAAEQIGTVEQ